MGKLDARRHLTLDVFAMYWHFVDVVWIFVFGSLYVAAHIT
jgi:heme/copper-type cytochrome/quinol oxidase subunit 3